MSILICGVSGAGKTTVSRKLEKNFKVLYEHGNNDLVDFWYQEHIKNTEPDHYAKNMYIMNKLAKNYLFAINNDDENVVYDRFIFDDKVAMELRVKERHPEIYKWMASKYHEYAQDLKTKNKLPRLAIILTVNDFEESKRRIIKRGREDEAYKITNDDTWYRKYFKVYSSVIKETLDEYGVKWIEIDVTNNIEGDTYNAVMNILKTE